MSDRSLKSIAKALGVLLLPLTALAADPSRVEKTFKSTSNPRISLSNLSGQVTIRGWSRTQIHTVYTTASPRVEVDTTVVPEAEPVEKIHFDTHVLDPLTTGKDQDTEYTMEVPFGSTLEVTNRQGGVTIENLQGEASVESVGSSVLVRDIAGHLAVRSVGGDIEVLRPAGRVEASSITGNLHFVSASGSQLRGITTSGRILYEGDLAPGGDYELSSYSGDIDVLCPAKKYPLAAPINAALFNFVGSIFAAVSKFV